MLINKKIDGRKRKIIINNNFHLTFPYFSTPEDVKRFVTNFAFFFFNLIITYDWLIVIFFLEIRDILDKIESKVALYQFFSKNQMQEGHTTDQRFKNLTELLKEASPNQVDVVDKGGHHDHLVYIYTSGTTGLPKAAVISNSR